jgi:hypothetical protein
MRKYCFWILLITIGGLLQLTACTEPPLPSLNSKDRNLIDSLYRDEVAILKPMLDSICDSRFEERIAQAVDSIMEIRVREIEEQLRRIRALESDL